MSNEPQFRIRVDPAPNDREKAAIAAAVVAMSRKLPDDAPVKPVNRWREAGKREARRGDFGE